MSINDQVMFEPKAVVPKFCFFNQCVFKAPNDGFLQNLLKTIFRLPDYFWTSRNAF